MICILSKYFAKTLDSKREFDVTNSAHTATITTIGVREGILPGVRKKFALKITICPETNFFRLIRIGPETS